MFCSRVLSVSILALPDQNLWAPVNALVCYLFILLYVYECLPSMRACAWCVWLVTSEIRRRHQSPQNRSYSTCGCWGLYKNNKCFIHSMVSPATMYIFLISWYSNGAFCKQDFSWEALFFQVYKWQRFRCDLVRAERHKDIERKHFVLGQGTACVRLILMLQWSPRIKEALT